MTYRRVVLGALLALTLPASAQVTDLGRAEFDSPVDKVIVVPGTPAVDDVHQFRNDLLNLIDELEKALDGATRNPLVGADVTRIIEAGGIVLPFPRSFRESIEAATYEEIAQARELMTAEHAMFAVPATIQAALAELQAVETVHRQADLCATNYGAFDGFKGKRTAIKWLKRATNVLSVTLQLTNLLKDLTGGTTEDTPYVGKVPAIPFMVIAGLQDISIQVLKVVSSSLATAKDVNELSIAACCLDPAPSQRLYGRGCDNRDNNCADGTDEAAEDLYAPSLEVDTSMLERCYIGAAEAREALGFAITATDDCSEVSPSIQLNVATSICTGFATLQVRDDSANTTFLGPLELKIDSQAPVLSVPPLQACYATITDARNDLERTVVTDCTDVLVDVDTVAAECAAQLSFSAVDECGNRSEYLDDVIVDGSPPQVHVRKLLLPSVDGLFCFDSPSSAVSAVENVVSISDNCTPDNDLDISTTASGPTCAMTVTTTAMDGCGRVGLDTLPVRIDSKPPAVSCSVATPTLWPADGTMQEIGFVMDVSDDCDPYGDIQIDVTVTSDEPTALARRTLGGDDPFPDAELINGADGNVETILLRAERSDYGPADGRLYRIRVVATDGCGLVSQADCWVDVPRQLNRGQGVNSGQKYRADRRN
jgi:hypothetical protein